MSDLCCYTYWTGGSGSRQGIRASQREGRLDMATIQGTPELCFHDLHLWDSTWHTCIRCGTESIYHPSRHYLLHSEEELCGI